jgi:type I restriction enzyme, S subunit
VTWADVTLGDLLRVEHGFAFKGEHFSDNGRLVVLTPGNFHEAGGFRPRPGKDRFYTARFPERYLLRKNSLIVAMTEQGEGLLGSAALIPEESTYLHNQRLGLVKEDRQRADRRFLYYLFNYESVRQQIRNSSSGAKVRHTSPERIYGVEVRVPEKTDEQKKIAAILSAYDDLIENNRRRIALLEKMAEEIYREWFVRLRFPGHEQAKFEKGLPVGWVSKKFGEFCKLKRGYDLPDDQVVPGPFPVVAATAVKTFHNQFKVEPPVITTGRSGSLGDVLITYQRAWPLNTTLYVQDCYGNSAFLIYYTLKFMGLESFNAGAGVPTLNRNHLNGIPMNVPPRGTQRAFDEQIAPIHRQVESLKGSTDLATRGRDALLPRLISGKLPVDALDIRFPSSMQLE